ncbi:hypothetical protein AMAG_19196 [Allomyces macrogynus ATCC 38327]|uniref:Uncharacterized protein n=1 Tax=Allomyces macrogynus (strain ATCC 38327) TaxID=578462 RepID=A0A0L0SSY1_ALLM3|nr:hypothetical protein AMAG_19196 [Allomyces macrogynus ATCC 38327]|eukprot:KNE65693.1 hypothetical protein AMAG_19196 [Allomyces macrogynus ATCC 38327]
MSSTQGPHDAAGPVPDRERVLSRNALLSEAYCLMSTYDSPAALFDAHLHDDTPEKLEFFRRHPVSLFVSALRE